MNGAKRFGLSLIPILAAGVLLFSFQNCSPSKVEFEDLSSQALKADFEYDYTQKASHFIQSALLLKPAPNPSKSFQVLIYVGTPTGQNDEGILRVQIRDERNRPICLTSDLNLSTGQKEWRIDCVPPFSFNKVKISLSLTGTFANYASEKIYSLN